MSNYLLKGRFELNGALYGLVIVGSNMIDLMNLSSFKRWGSSVKVADINNITPEELNKVFDGVKFKKID